MYIDTHAHLYLEEFEEDIDLVVELMVEAEVEHVYLPNVDSLSIESLMGITEDYKEIMHPMMGIHPCSIKENYKQELSIAEKYLATSEFCAVGEIGIDLFWDKTFYKEQLEAFEIQIEWARDLKLPFVIHSRDSLDETINMVQKLQKGDLNGIFHCFNGTHDQGMRIRDLGFLIGIGGIITYKNSGVKENIKLLPLEMMVLETDAPYLSPVPFRGKRNQSNYIPIIADQLATTLEVKLEKVQEMTTANAFKLYGTPK